MNIAFEEAKALQARIEKLQEPLPASLELAKLRKAHVENHRLIERFATEVGQQELARIFEINNLAACRNELLERAKTQ